MNATKSNDVKVSKIDTNIMREVTIGKSTFQFFPGSGRYLDPENPKWAMYTNTDPVDESLYETMGEEIDGEEDDIIVNTTTRVKAKVRDNATVVASVPRKEKVTKFDVEVCILRLGQYKDKLLFMPEFVAQLNVICAQDRITTKNSDGSTTYTSLIKSDAANKDATIALVKKCLANDKKFAEIIWK